MSFELDNHPRISMGAEKFAFDAVINPRLKIPTQFLSDIAARFPDETQILEKEPEKPEYEAPENFQLLKDIEDRFQTGEVAIPRDEFTYQRYLQARSQPSYSNLEFVKSTLMNGLPIHISRNNFPFNVGSDTIHSVLWVLPEVEQEQRNKYLAAWAFFKKLEPRDLVIRRNPIFNQSIRAIPHYHILYKVGVEENLGFDCL